MNACVCFNGERPEQSCTTLKNVRASRLDIVEPSCIPPDVTLSVDTVNQFGTFDVLIEVFVAISSFQVGTSLHDVLFALSFFLLHTDTHFSFLVSAVYSSTSSRLLAILLKY